MPPESAGAPTAQAKLGILDHVSALKDPRQAWKVVYPLPEVLLLVLAATLAGAEDFVEIGEWGEAHLDFLRTFLPYRDGIPSHHALNDLVNALDSELFKTCSTSWVERLRDSDPEIIAIDGKTSRRTHNRSKGSEPLHLISAWPRLRPHGEPRNRRVADPIAFREAVPHALAMLPRPVHDRARHADVEHTVGLARHYVDPVGLLLRDRQQSPRARLRSVKIPDSRAMARLPGTQDERFVHSESGGNRALVDVQPMRNPCQPSPLSSTQKNPSRPHSHTSVRPSITMTRSWGTSRCGICFWLRSATCPRRQRMMPPCEHTTTSRSIELSQFTTRVITIA